MKTIYQSLCFEMNNPVPQAMAALSPRKLLRSIVLSILLGISSTPAFADDLLVAVASNFIKPMQAISQQFTESTGHKVTLSFGSSGKLMAQIRHGAPFDLFLSADQDKVTRLLEKELAVSGSEFIYAQGRLVLWSGKQELVDTSGDVLKSDKFRYIALADAKLAPYGKAAEQVISALGIEQHLKPRVVKGENISQTYQFVRTGNADLGFVALSQVQHHPESLKGSQWLIPRDYHEPIDQYAVILKRAKHKDAATEFSQFLQRKSTHALIRSFGYDLPTSVQLAESDQSCDYAYLR
ncbi:molybdate ABC transporter substrate-binding protein [Leucothrix pacifica]|nr:molybdate ABC transporter substrate-binding protein [Leucothrix pacifica]